MLQQCYLESDHTTMFYAAKALMTLQALYGVIPNLYGKGECAAVCITLHYIRVKVNNARHFSHFTITLQFSLQSKQVKERRPRTNEILI